MTQRPSIRRPPPTEAERINHIISHAREAQAILGDINPADLERNRMQQLSLNYLVAVVGEAANQLTPATQRALPQIPWGKIIGMRNILIHQYHIVQPAIVHDTVVNDLPALIDALDTFIPIHPGGQPS